MAVVIETTLGDITIDLYINERPKACLNFLKLCRIKYYNFNLFHTVNQGFIAHTGDPTGSRTGGESIWGVMEGPTRRYFEAENTPRIKHTTTGLVSFVGDKDSMIGSQFFITLAPDLTYLDSQHCVFGEVTEGFEILRQLNEAICDSDHRPYQDIRITHTVVLEDPFPDPENLKIPDASPEPTAERLAGGRIAPDEEIDETEGKTVHEVQEIIAEKEAKARATILEMIGDIPDAEMAPPENVLFVCKLNPVTNDDDLEIIFSRFGKIKSCEVIRDKKSGDSLQYAFVEFEEQKSCEDAYFKMDNVLIDDRRIHVDFSQSVAKIKWHGKGRGVTHYNERGEKQRDDPKNDIGNGRYRKRDISDSPPPRKTDRRDDKFKSRERYEENNYRNRNFDSRKPQRDRRDDRYREDKYRQNYDESRRRNRSKSIENNQYRYEENRKNQQRNRSRSRDYNRPKQDYRRKEQLSPPRSKENIKSRHRNISPENRQYRRKYEKSRSRSRDDYRSKYKYTSVEEKGNGRKETQYYTYNKKYNNEDKKKAKKYEESSDEEVRKKKKNKKRKQESSSKDSTSEDELVKKSKKKKKKSKKKNSDSESQSDSEEDRKKSKKKKKKSKKQQSSSDSTSESDSNVSKNKKRKR